MGETGPPALCVMDVPQGRPGGHATPPGHETAMALRSRAISPGRPRSFMIRPMAS
jgi:hypothetical protein